MIDIIIIILWYNIKYAIIIALRLVELAIRSNTDFILYYKFLNPFTTIFTQRH